MFCAVGVVKGTARILSYDTIVIVLRVIHIATDRVDLPIYVADERPSTNPFSFRFRLGKQIHHYRDRQNHEQNGPYPSSTAVLFLLKLILRHCHGRC